MGWGILTLLCLVTVILWMMGTDSTQIFTISVRQNTLNIGRITGLSGSPPMVQSIKKQLIQKGVNKTNIHSEEFSMS